MPTCTHNGCKKEFNEAESQDNECLYHPGAPVFHEGLKGWSCCKKRVTDFDEFLGMEGCTFGKHSTVKADLPTPTTKDEAKIVADDVTKEGVEVYGTASVKPTKPAAETIQQPIEIPAAKEEPVVEEEDDPSVAVKEGTTCKRSGCGATYKGDAISRGDGAEAICVYHPGTPIFHEGSKGWSCCKRKVLEFDEFLKIKGCKEGKHLFVGKKSSGEERVECRRDWYQTPTRVIINIFAKNKEESIVNINEKSIFVDIKMKDQKRYVEEIPLFDKIDTEKSKFEVLSTKIEIVLEKTDGVSWPDLQPTDNVKTWTTFGVNGGGGTVGAKEMQYVADAPIHKRS